MKYLVLGAGGTGGCIGAFMAEGGKDVTLIARGEHLEKIQKNGLMFEKGSEGVRSIKVKATDMDGYNDNPDVIFVCVKGYSIDEAIPFIKRVANDNTVVIPILNIYGTGERLQKDLPGILVTDGCIYVASQIKEPGLIWMNGDIFRVVFGVRDEAEYRPVLKEIEKDLIDSGITGILSDNIKRDALQKFSYVSPAAACGVLYDTDAGMMQVPGKYRDTFAGLINEIDILAKAMDIHFTVDVVKTNLDILDKLTPQASTSMQRDVAAGKASEMDGLIFEVVRLAERYGVDLPIYKMVADEMHKRGY